MGSCQVAGHITRAMPDAEPPPYCQVPEARAAPPGPSSARPPAGGTGFHQVVIRNHLAADHSSGRKTGTAGEVVIVRKDWRAEDGLWALRGDGVLWPSGAAGSLYFGCWWNGPGGRGAEPAQVGQPRLDASALPMPLQILTPSKLQEAPPPNAGQAPGMMISSAQPADGSVAMP